MRSSKSTPRRFSAKSQGSGKTSVAGKNGSEFKYDLTIGMIIKNEIDHLRTCLETMKPLREALNCQLIITDTGSTDGARELAAEYADVLLDFEWCDDFSAARNTGIEKAEGRWFAYFDTDHEFDESILEIATFLKSKDCDQYDNASVTIIDYHGSEGDYLLRESKKPLLVNFCRGKRYFEGKIHEYLPLEITNFSEIPMRLKHWGYIDAVQDDKHERNIPLIEKEIENDPKYLKNYFQLAQESKDLRYAREVLEKGIAIGKEEKEKSSYYYVLHMRLLFTMSNLQDWEEFDRVAERVNREVVSVFPDSLFEQEYYGLVLRKQFLASNSGTFIDEEKTVALYDRYITLYHQLKRNENDVFSILYTYLTKMPEFFFSVEHQVLLLMARSSKFKEKARGILQQSEGHCYTSVNQFTPFVADYVKVALELGDGVSIGNMYRYHMVHAVEQNKTSIQMVADDFEKKLEGEERLEFLGMLSQDVFSVRTALYALEASGFDLKKCDKKAVTLLEGEEGIYYETVYRVLAYGYFAYGKDPFDYMGKSLFAVLLSGCTGYFSERGEFLELVGKATERSDFVSLKERRLIGYLAYRAGLYLAEQEEMDISRVKYFTEKGTLLLCGYLPEVYLPEMLSEGGRDIVAPEELFAIFMGEALGEREKNPVAYVNGLKRALGVCPAYGPLVSALMTGLGGKEETDELAELGRQVKGNIRSLVKQGKLKEAGELLEKYKMIQPDDGEIGELMGVCKGE